MDRADVALHLDRIRERIPQVPHPTADQLDALARLAATAPTAGRLGLTNYVTPEAALAGLVLPAVLALRWLSPEGPLRALEIGAGSGIAGTALAILCPGWQVTLLDRRKTAAAYMQVAALRLSVGNLQVIRGEARRARGEDLYDAVLFRGVARVTEDLAMAAGWVRPQGLAVVWTRPEEVESLILPPGWGSLGWESAPDSRLVAVCWQAQA